MKNDTNYLLNISVKSAVFLVVTLLIFCFGLSYCGSAFENQEMPVNDPCNYTFYIMDGQECQALFKFYDCENGGTIEVSTDKPIFDIETMQRLLATEKTAGLKGYKNRFEIDENRKTLRVKYQLERIALTDTLILMVKNFKSK